MVRPKTIFTTAALMAVCAAPASAATWEEMHTSGVVAPAPSSITASTGEDYQDLRSPDARDAANHRGLHEVDASGYVLNRGYGSPDAADAARDLPTVQVPDQVVELPEVSSGGFDWGDAAIGAAGMLALFSIAAGSALLLMGRKRRRGVRLAT